MPDELTLQVISRASRVSSVSATPVMMAWSLLLVHPPPDYGGPDARRVVPAQVKQLSSCQSLVLFHAVVAFGVLREEASISLL